MTKIRRITSSGAANDAVATKIAPAKIQRGRVVVRAIIHAVERPASSPEPRNTAYPKALPANVAVAEAVMQTHTTARMKNGARAAKARPRLPWRGAPGLRLPAQFPLPTERRGPAGAMRRSEFHIRPPAMLVPPCRSPRKVAWVSVLSPERAGGSDSVERVGYRQSERARLVRSIGRTSARAARAARRVEIGGSRRFQPPNLGEVVRDAVGEMCPNPAEGCQYRCRCCWPSGCEDRRHGLRLPLLGVPGSAWSACPELPRVGFANAGGVVFVDESAEEIATAKAGRRGQRRWVAATGPAVGW